MVYEKIHLNEKFKVLGNNGCDPLLEIYLPDDMPKGEHEDKKRPCMVICPGGGYAICSPREAEPIGLHFLPEGFNVFVLTYSVPEQRFPTQIREVAAVMEIIHENADNWNCDTEKIAIIGFSAGGHLAAHYSTMFDCKEVREVFPESKPVNASILSYPVITANPDYAHKGSFVNLLGAFPEGAEAEYFSCEKNVRETTPPAFIWHTASDNVVPVENSLLYAAALSKYKIPYELHIYPFGSHGLATCDGLTNANMTDIIRHDRQWLDSAKRWLKFTFNI